MISTLKLPPLSHPNLKHATDPILHGVWCNLHWYQNWKPFSWSRTNRHVRTPFVPFSARLVQIWQTIREQLSKVRNVASIGVFRWKNINRSRIWQSVLKQTKTIARCVLSRSKPMQADGHLHLQQQELREHRAEHELVINLENFIIFELPKQCWLAVIG